MPLGAVGGAASYGGFLEGRKANQQLDKGDIELQNAQIEQQGTEALGNAIKLFQQQVPGAQPMPQAPQPPMPGQPSQPMMRLQAQAPGGPGMLSQPPPASDPTWSVGPSPAAPAAAPAAPTAGPASFDSRFGSGAQPPATAPAQAAPAARPAASQQQQQPDITAALARSPMAGKLDLQTIVQHVVKANPGANPAVIAAAVSKAIPLMNAQAQMDWKQSMLALRRDTLDERTTHNIEQEGTSKQRADTQATNVGSLVERRGAQTQQGQQRVETQAADVGSKIERRGAQTQQGERRLGQYDTAEEGRNTRAGSAEAGKQGRFDTAETRREKFLSERIRLQDAALDRAMKRDKTLADNAENRRTLRLMEDENNAEFKRAGLKIQGSNTMAPKQRDQLQKDAETAYNNARMRIEGYKRQMSGGAGPAADSGAPPMEVLKPGEITHFENGQSWTIENGKPKRVK